MNEPVAVDSSRASAAARAGSKRKALLRATLQDIILAEGFARLSVSEIAARLGCSKRTIYELAPTKNDLVLQVIARFFETVRADAELASANCDDPARQIFEYLQVGVRAAQRLSPAAVADIDKWEPARVLWQAHIRLRVDGLRKLIERGIETGAFRDIHPVLVAEMVFAGLNRLREPDFYTSTDLKLSEAFEEYYKMLLHALVPHPGSA